MKKLLLLITLFVLVSCEKDSEPTPLTQAEQEYVNSFLVGTWIDMDDNNGYCCFSEDFIYSNYVANSDGSIAKYIVEPTHYAISKCPWGDKDFMYRVNLNSTYIDLLIMISDDDSTIKMYFFRPDSKKNILTHIYKKITY